MKNKIIWLIADIILALLCIFIFVATIIIEPESTIPIVFTGITAACWIGNVIITIIEIRELRRNRK